MKHLFNKASLDDQAPGQAGRVLMLALLFLVCTAGDVPAYGLLSPPQSGLSSFIFVTEPPGADIRISLDNGATNSKIGRSGYPVLMDANKICRVEKVLVIFEKADYDNSTAYIEGAWFRNHRRYPEKGELRLTSSYREIVFRTSPPGCKVYLDLFSNPQAPAYLCRAGDRYQLNTYGMAPCQSYKLSFRLDLYRDETGTITRESLRSGSVNYYPPDGDTIRLKPVIPIVVPLYHWFSTHVIESIAGATIGIPVTLYLLFGLIIPGTKRRRERESRIARIEQITADSADRTGMCGRHFGNYMIVEKIGEGGMASVYRAVPESTLEEDEAVALKVMQSRFQDDLQFERRFRREMRILKELNHPGILRILDYGDWNGQLYIAMEFIKGRTLRNRLAGQAQPFDEFMASYRQILQAMEYAHSKGIVHRDLKPDNIMMRDDGRVVVMDFGLARGENYSAITVSGTAMGTPAYMAPEQIQEGGQDSKTDQYALGIIAYEMLTGEVPFQDRIAAHVLFKHLSDPPRPPGELRSDLPPELERIILKMLEKEPEKRFSSLSEVEEAMEKAILEYEKQS